MLGLECFLTKEYGLLTIFGGRLNDGEMNKPTYVSIQLFVAHSQQRVSDKHTIRTNTPVKFDAFPFTIDRRSYLRFKISNNIRIKYPLDFTNSTHLSANKNKYMNSLCCSSYSSFNSRTLVFSVSRINPNGKVCMKQFLSRLDGRGY